MFAFFVVLYAIAINKDEQFQILSDSLEQVFDKSARQHSAQGEERLMVMGFLTDRATPEQESTLRREYSKTGARPSAYSTVKVIQATYKQKYLGKPLDSLLTKLQSALIDEIRDGEASLELNRRLAGNRAQLRNVIFKWQLSRSLASKASG